MCLLICLLHWIISSIEVKIKYYLISTCCLQSRRPRFDPWFGKIPSRRKWLSSPVFLPGESIPWTEEPSGLQSMGSQRVGDDWATNTFTFTSLLVTKHYSDQHKTDNTDLLIE